MILNENKSTPFRIIEPKKFHHAQQIPVSLSNQQIPILSREDYRNNNVITLSNQKNLSNEQNISTLISERQLNQKEFRQSQPRSRNISDTDSSYLPETTSESGISDLDMNEKCICCPYGYHIDVDFVTFLNNFGEKNFNKQIKKINQKRNENIQKSMEYVIDEVEKIKQMNELSSSTKEPMDYINRYEKIQNSHNQTIVPNNLKKTIKQIDRFINHDGNFSNIDHDSNQSCRLPKKSIRIDQIKDNHHYLSNSSLPSENSLLKTSQSFNLNQIELGNTPRRSYSSCAEPISRTSNKIIRSQTNQRRCLSNRTSPIRSNFPVNSLPFRHIHDARRSYSTSRRTQSQSPIEKQSYKREIKINLSRPQNEYSVKEHICNDEYELKKKTCKNSVILQENSVKKPITNSISMINPIEVQEEVLLNLFSCNNSDSLSSESSESLVEIEQNLKINETYEKSEPIIEYKKENKCPSNTILEKRLIELEKKLQKIPELEIKNNILLEEKKLLLNQLLCRNKVTTQPQQNIQPPKVYRSIGCDSLEKSKRDVGISVKSNTRDFGLHVNEPSEKIAEMETVITNLKDQLKEQTLIIQQTQAKPITRDVAVMHVVDKVEEPPKPKPEYRDVAIHHSTVDENKILVEKQSYIINDYMKEIEQLQIENSHLSANLQELIKKHSKHVVTRGTYAPEQPLLYSIGINTKNISTRDVQVMYTPKSRDVCLSTDQFIHTRDVSLGCNIEDSEIKTQLDELNLIKKKYEQIVQENLNNIKSYRDVNILCRLDQKDCRDVSLGCNMQPVKDYRDVSLTCDIDKETKNYRDVSIGVQLDSKPEQKDANVYVNITESITRPVMKDSSSMAEFEDQEKIKLLREIEELKKPVMKKNAYVSVDFNTRLMNNLLKNNSSGTELIEKNNKQINTDQKTTREISIGNNFCYFDRSCQTLNSREYNSEQDQIKNIALERDKLKIINENLRLELIQMEEKLKKEKIENKNYDIKSNDFNNSTSISTVTANINCFSDSNISQIKTSSLETDPIKIKRQSEFEHHRIQKTEKNKRTIEDTVKLSASVSNKYGDKATEMASWSNKSEINYDRNEVTIPIVNEQKINYKPPIIQNQLFMTNSIENDSFDNLQSKKSTGQKFDDSITEKVESKNPKSILKQSAVFSSSKINKSMGKALTFGENEILETEIDYGHDEIFDKSEIVFDYTTKENENLKESQDENENILLNKHDEQKNIDKKTDVQILEKIETEVFQEPKSLSIIKDDENSSNNDFELELELHIACAILNDSLYEPLKADKNKVAKALNLIQQDWFKLAAQKESNPVLVEEHLNAFYTRFSNLLLERIVNMADLNHNTALHYSVSTGNFEIVNLLLDTKVCDVNAQNKAGYTSIMLAAVVPIKDDFERMTLKRLFSEGNVNIKSIDSGQTALMLAVRHGNKDTVALLLESSADCNAQDKEGSTALMAACEHGHIDIVRLLLDNTNCDPDIKDNDGETAFDIAKNKNRNDIIVLLYAHSTKLRSHHPAIQFSKTRPRIGSNGSTKK